MGIFRFSLGGFFCFFFVYQWNKEEPTPIGPYPMSTTSLSSTLYEGPAPEAVPVHRSRSYSLLSPVLFILQSQSGRPRHPSGRDPNPLCPRVHSHSVGSLPSLPPTTTISRHHWSYFLHWRTGWSSFTFTKSQVSGGGPCSEVQKRWVNQEGPRNPFVSPVVGVEFCPYLMTSGVRVEEGTTPTRHKRRRGRAGPRRGTPSIKWVSKSQITRGSYKVFVPATYSFTSERGREYPACLSPSAYEQPTSVQHFGSSPPHSPPFPRSSLDPRSPNCRSRTRCGFVSLRWITSVV